MKILVLTTLYPNAAMPLHGVFVENRLRAYLDKYRAEAKVIAPAPWFPFTAAGFGKYAAYARTPLTEKRHNIEVVHPRYFLPPKIGMNYAPAALEKAFYAAAIKFRNAGWDFDLIDAHYFYPDGVAAMRIARRLEKPLVITARGTDVNLIPKFPRPRRLIIEAANAAGAVITVAEALKTELAKIGVDPKQITALRNGVDLTNFSPRDRDAARTRFGVQGRVIASVGHLIDRKGHDLVIDALAALPDVSLLIAGDGEKRSALQAQASRLGVADRTKFVGALPHQDLADLYSAADALVLASSREGWPNVLLEAMACGTPAVATNVWGSSEVITAAAAGRLVKTRDAAQIADALNDLFKDPPDRAETRRYAEQFSWDATIDAMHEIFGRLAPGMQGSAT